MGIIFDYKSDSCQSFISFILKAGMREMSRAEIINAYEQHKYGVTIQNFIDAGLSIPHKKGTNREESKHIK
jgi:hypothetical protein